MAIDERLRLKIHTKLTELLGSEEATALIEHIMLVPWHDVATKDDLENLRVELRAGITVVRSDMDVLRADMGRDMADLRTEMAGLRTEMHQGFAAQTRWLMGYVTALSAIMLAVARLLF
jgi:hypothetical protein